MKTKKRILKEFLLGEISVVHDPAQQGARAAIMKTASAPKEFAFVPAVIWDGNGTFTKVRADDDAVLVLLQREAARLQEKLADLAGLIKQEKAMSPQEAIEKAREKHGPQATRRQELRKALEEFPEAFGYQRQSRPTRQEIVVREITDYTNRAVASAVNKLAEEIRKQTQCTPRDAVVAARAMIDDDANAAHESFMQRAEEIGKHDKCSGAAAMRKARLELNPTEDKRQSVVKSQEFAAFESRVAQVWKRDKCSQMEAMKRARREFPDEFEAYQAA